MSDVTHSAATAAGAHRTDKDASSNQDPHAEHSVPMSTYWIVFILLMVFLIITVIAAFIPLGPLNMPVAMTIATIKAILVVLFFMHVKFASRLTKVFVAASVTWLAIMFVMTFMDYESRSWLSNSRGWVDNPVKAAYDEGSKAYHQGKSGEAHGEEMREENPGGQHVGDPAAGTTNTPGTDSKNAPGPGHPGSG
jgi:cytochrome c oxidase subunit 4